MNDQVKPGNNASPMRRSSIFLVRARLSKPAGEEGSILVLAALSMVVLLGLLALATDVGVLFLNRRNAQTAADAAAVAAAKEIQYMATDGTSLVATADAAAAENGFTNGANGVTVTVYNGPADGPHTGDLNYVEVIVQRVVPTYFMRVLGRDSMLVSARAVGGSNTAHGCIYALGTTGTGITRIGSGDITVDDCDIYDNAGFNHTGSGSISAAAIGVVGSVKDVGSGTVSPTPQPMNIVSDPLSYLTPPTFDPTSCQAAITVSTAIVQNVSPPPPGGCINGITVKGSGGINFASGFYVINGNLDFAGSGPVSYTGIHDHVNGQTGTDGVTFYVTGSTTVNGNSNMDLEAPSSNTLPYYGILFWEARGDTQPVTITGTTGTTLLGIVYAPDAQVSFSGTGSANIYTDFVVGSLSLNGSIGFTNYNTLSPLSPPSSLKTPGLVE